MSKKKIDNYDSEYTYKKEGITIENKEFKHPIIERTNNALLYPEIPKNNLDMDQFKSND